MPTDIPYLRAAFSSAVVKCNRGGELIHWLESEIVPTVTKQAEVVTTYDEKTDTETLKLVVHPTPLTVALIVGEILHNIRNSLDYLISSIVANVTKKADTRVSFPFHEKKKTFLRSRESHRLYQNAPDVWQIIEDQFKPYADEDGNRLLWSINRLNNNDKHRLLAVTTQTGVAGGDLNVYGPGNRRRIARSCSYILTGPGEMPLGSGSQVTHELEVSTRLILAEPEVIGTPELIPFLKECFNTVGSIGYTLQAHLFGEDEMSEG